MTHSLTARSRPMSFYATVFTLALLAAASTWFYFNHILRPAQVADAAVHNRPRGNLSDLYPRWLGARELLLHGRNPYSQEITIEIQRGYYGRPLNSSNPGDPKDQQGFAYPVYVVFLLAPAIYLPFHIVQAGFRWLIVAATAGSVLCWLLTLRWKPRCWAKVICIVLVLGSLAVVQGIKLQQLSLLIAALLAGCMACLSAGYFVFAGILLGLSTVKPQLALPAVLWLLLWSASAWRFRWKFAAAFAIVMILLLGGAELLLPGWWSMFLQGIRQYHEYTQNQSVMEWLVGQSLGRICEALAVLSCGICLWPLHRESAASADFGESTALVLALTVLIVPMFAPYNQIVLLPAILFLVRRAFDGSDASRAINLARAMGALLFLWPWITTMGLTAMSPWLTPDERQNLWKLPFYSTFTFPVYIFGLTLWEMWPASRRILRVQAPAE